MQVNAEFVRPGDLFVPRRRGDMSFEHQFQLAVRRGAGAIATTVPMERMPLPQLVFTDMALRVPKLAAHVHGDPSESIDVVGVTGTDGKTTVTWLVDSILRAAGRRSAVAGTIGVRLDGRPLTVDQAGAAMAADLHRLLGELVDLDVDALSIEVTSTSLHGHHADACRFAVTAFTNLAHEHLDVHGSMENYFETKATLFDERSEHGVVVVDGSWGRRLAERLDHDGRTTVSCDPDGDADLRATDIELHGDRCRFSAIGLGLRAAATSIELPVTGRHNVSNALVAAACARVLGVRTEDIVAGLASAIMPPGRLERVPTGKDEPTVYVDFAHTPQGIGAAVRAGRATAGGRVIVVVGAGGDRDRTKRTDMGAAASDADLVYVTSDNPRSEDPARITSEVARGVEVGSAEVVEEPDRRLAITRAIEVAEAGDVVLLLGKGHERTLTQAGESTPFDDRVVATEALEARRSPG
ncbi:MAG: UDP-N-acetylmuramoyl-L-alanyl-D-glutamate--2,6-diaminopimelate ligase [Actinomycetota bacterium]